MSLKREEKKGQRRIGMFSTIPVEYVYGAGAVPMDLNNRFVTGSDTREILRRSDQARLPRSTCAWTRGLFGASLMEGLEEVIVVVDGDCAMNGAMSRILETRGIAVHPFYYPLASSSPGRFLERELKRFGESLGTTPAKLERAKGEILECRRGLQRLDCLNWEESRIPAEAMRLALLQSTDFNGDPSAFQRDLLGLEEKSRHLPRRSGPRLALFGVPSALSDLVSFLEEAGGNFVHFEVEYDFAMLPVVEDLVTQYERYAYPRGIARRLEKFLFNCREREVEGVVVYQQEFCHHNLEHRALLSAFAGYPVLVVEGDEPLALTARDKIRLEAYMESLQGKMRAKKGEDSLPRSAVGLDVGSRFAKGVAVGEGGTSVKTLETIAFFKRFVRRGPEGPSLNRREVFDWLGLGDHDPDEVAFVATGYGRHLARFSGTRVISEIQAHGMGASAQCPGASFVLLDLGGQDSKAIRVSDGVVQEFVMNDKCAAGSGRYVENMVRLLDLELGEVLQVNALPVPLTNVCATFGESEVIGHLMDGVGLEQIAAGILASVAQRAAQLLGRLGGLAEGEQLYLSGGLSGSGTLRRFLASDVGTDRVDALLVGRFNGAVGCLVELGVSPDWDVVRRAEEKTIGNSVASSVSAAIMQAEPGKGE